MKHEFMAYWPGTHNWSMATVKADLPKWVRDELLDIGKPTEQHVWVDAANQKVCKYLDQYLKIGRRRKFLREFRVEADSSEIDSYDYFRIWFRDTLSWGNDVTFDFTRPSCSGVSGACPTGFEITSSVRVEESLNPQLACAQFVFGLGQEYAFIISDDTKHGFLAAGFTGLSYASCELTESSSSAFHVARISSAAPEHAAKIRQSKNYCKRCKIAWAPILFGRSVAKEALVDDFIRLDRFIVGSTAYSYRMSGWIISRRVLRHLLDSDTIRLQKQGLVLDSTFAPVVHVV